MGKVLITSLEKVYLEKKIEEIRPQVSVKMSTMDDLNVYWDDKLNVKNGKLGLFNCLRPNEISLSSDGKDNPDMILSILAHELHHRWQLETYGLLYIVMDVPIFRYFMLEPTAYCLQHEVEKLMGLEE